MPKNYSYELAIEGKEQEPVIVTPSNNGRHYAMSPATWQAAYKKGSTVCPLCKGTMLLIEGKRPEFYCSPCHIAAGPVYNEGTINIDPSDVSNIMARSNADMPLFTKKKKKYY